MDFLNEMFRSFMHLDESLTYVISSYGDLFYVILFLVIFCETGLVITPFLPGDSLLFACGAFSAKGMLDVYLTASVILVAGILGDTANYHIGKFLGAQAIIKYPRIFKKDYIDKTHSFYEKYGGKTIVIARFVPIVRTFAPFLAGVGYMRYLKFVVYNITGAALWVIIVFGGGYFFGNLDVVKNNFSFVILAIIVISVLPIVLEYFKNIKS